MPQSHWQNVYQQKNVNECSWFQNESQLSFALFSKCQLTPQSPVIDVGAGASPFLQQVLQHGFSELHALDIAQSALAQNQQMLGEHAKRIHWHIGDILHFSHPQKFAFWHDRAVFHFFTKPFEQQAYKQTLLSQLADNAYVLIASFAPDGPKKCSGLDTKAWDAPSLQQFLGNKFTLVETCDEQHSTPGGSQQHFNYCLFAFNR